MRRSARGDRGGFTMVEIIVVVAIIVVLAGMILPRFIGRVGQAKQGVAKQKCSAIENAIEIFRADYDRYPQTLEELVVRPSDIPEEKWNPPVLKSKDLIDPWDRPFGYKYPGDHSEVPYDVYSLGADGEEGGEKDNADIVNW